jgi:hypothetical protein
MGWQMAKATIKSKTGAVITVEGTEAEVSNIISTFERTATMGNAKEAIARTQAKKSDVKKRENASDLIIGLKEGGFFEKAKKLGDVAAALEEQGFLYPVTTLSGVMLSLVQKKQLRRKKQDGAWVYGK